MSRIYEALRRAEAEKQAGSESGSFASQSVLEPAWPETGDVLPEPSLDEASQLEANPDYPSSVEAEILPGFPSTQSRQTPLQTPAEDAEGLVRLDAEASASILDSGAVSDHGIDLSNIASAPWTPVLEHLPAVQERGRTVEQFRSLRSRMQEIRGANRLKSILVTSGLPQEGKSFVAVNLAVSLARHKISSVLLIDGDMRRSSLHRILGCPNDGPGLTEYLSGQATLQQIMKRAAPNVSGAPLPHGFASLIFIGAGSEADKAADLSGNHRFEELMAIVSPLFDWVIVDSSPVNLVSDGVNLARACDGVLLIARGEVTKFETAQQAVAALEASKVLGFVLNAVNSNFASSGYYDYDSTADRTSAQPS